MIAAERIRLTLEAEETKKVIFLAPYSALARQQASLLLRHVGKLHLQQDDAALSKGSSQLAAAKGAEASAGGDQARKQDYCTSINAILQLFSVFSVEQMNSFVSQKLIKEKLFKEFNASINATKDQDVKDFVADRLGEESKE